MLWNWFQATVSEKTGRQYSNSIWIRCKDWWCVILREIDFLLKFVIDSLLISPVAWSCFNTDMCKFESSQKDESRAQSADSSKAYRKPSRAFKCRQYPVSHKFGRSSSFPLKLHKEDTGQTTLLTLIFWEGVRCPHLEQHQQSWIPEYGQGLSWSHSSLNTFLASPTLERMIFVVPGSDGVSRRVSRPVFWSLGLRSRRISVSKVSGLVSVSVSKDFGLGLELLVSRLCVGYC